VVLAGLDAFNLCAFFVLLFLLSLMVHARRRMRMALVGGVFVAFSGLLYYVCMAACGLTYPPPGISRCAPRSRSRGCGEYSERRPDAALIAA
jgi:hypothetical protein